jgi:hypothetical protein
MIAALAATLSRPAWWSMALAAFLVRGGIAVVLLPLIDLPAPAVLESALAPTINALAFGGLTPEVLLGILVIATAAMVLLAVSGLSGAWLDRAQLHEAATDEDLELAWTPGGTSLRDALALRLAAHLPTLAALAYATFRLIGAAYDELLSPGDAAVPLALRIVLGAPEAVLLVLGTWLGGEAIGAQAARHAAAGATFRDALARATRQMASWRGLGTFVMTTLAVVAVLAPFVLVAARSWEHVRDLLFADAHPALVGAGVLVLVATWVLGLAITGAALAWRTAAWTAEVSPARRATAAPSSVAKDTRESAIEA